MLTPLASREQLTVTETDVTRSTRTVVEMRAVETDRHFRFLEECVDWVADRLVREARECSLLLWLLLW